MKVILLVLSGLVLVFLIAYLHAGLTKDWMDLGEIDNYDA